MPSSLGLPPSGVTGSGSFAARSASLQAGIAERSEAKLPHLFVQGGAAARQYGAAPFVRPGSGVPSSLGLPPSGVTESGSFAARSASLQAGIAERSEAKLPHLFVQGGAAARQYGAAPFVRLGNGVPSSLGLPPSGVTGSGSFAASGRDAGRRPALRAKPAFLDLGKEVPHPFFLRTQVVAGVLVRRNLDGNPLLDD